MKPKFDELMADEIVLTIKRAIDPLKLKLEEQAQEIAALKARPLQKWAGVHIEGVPYAEASLVTRQGSLWVSTAATSTTPGLPGSDWRLIVKKGAAG